MENMIIIIVCVSLYCLWSNKPLIFAVFTSKTDMYNLTLCAAYYSSYCHGAGTIIVNPNNKTALVLSWVLYTGIFRNNPSTRWR